jgi:hypothetical protein
MATTEWLGRAADLLLDNRLIIIASYTNEHKS